MSLNLYPSLIKHISRRSPFNKILNNIRFASSTTKTTASEHRVVITDDGSTIVAWHPKQDFPYECTKPLPEVKEDINAGTVLKSALTAELKQIFKPKNEVQAREQLMDITFTTKHRWFPRSRDKRAKKTLPDRPYL